MRIIHRYGRLLSAPPGKPVRIVPMGDSLVNPVLTTTSRLAARFQGAAITFAPAISHPGESTRNYLDSHQSEVAAAVDASYDNYALVSLNTNDVNQDYIDTVKSNNLSFINFLLASGYKGVIWMDVAACQSPYAYARDANGTIIGTNPTDQQTGFDSARKALNAYLRTLVGGKLAAVGDLSGYANIYLQANASDTRYFYAAGTGPYGTGEPGGVHFNNDYGTPYWAEGAAQAIYRATGIAPIPPTVTIPDAPAGSNSLANPYDSDYQTNSPNVAFQDGHWQRTSGANGWDATVTSKVKVQRAPTGTQEVNILFAQPRNGYIPGSTDGNHESVMFGFGPLASYSETGFGWYSANLYNDVDKYAVYQGLALIKNNGLGSGRPLFNIRPSAQTAGQFDVTYKIGDFPLATVTMPITFPIIAAATLFSTGPSRPGFGPSEAPAVSIGSVSTMLR